MIDLVLKATREQLIGLDLERFPLEIERAYAHANGTLDVAIHVGDRQTTLFGFGGFRIELDDFRIDDHERLVVDVDDRQPFAASDLRRREADAFRQIHRVEHVLREHAQRVGDLFDRTRLLAKYRIAEDANVEN